MLFQGCVFSNVTIINKMSYIVWKWKILTKHEMFFGFTTLRYVGDTPATVMSDSHAGSTADSAGGQ